MKFLDTDKMQYSVQKINTYQREELKELNTIKQILNQLNDYYKTNNNKYLNQLDTSITRKGEIINSIHKNNIVVLNERINQHLLLEQENKSLLEQ